MKLGKRRQVAHVPGVPGVTIPIAGPKGARRRPTGPSSTPAAPSFSAPAEPARDSWTVPLGEQHGAGGPDAAAAHDEPVVEGEAVELPPVEPARPVYEPSSSAPAGTDPMPFPVAGEPVAVVAPGAGGAQTATLGDSGEAFASGHAAAPGPSWQEPMMELANERPELVVAAAFAGGILAALILRRLGR
jgi:hypothetical protein